MARTHALATNNYGTATLIVATSAANGTHITLATAMADAVSGDTIFLRDSVTENVTLPAGINITAWTGGTLNTPTITGTLTMTTAGTCNISGIRLQTNSAALLAVTGSAASIVNLNNCYLNCTNNTGITYSSSSASSKITVNSCTGDLGTTGIGYHTMSSTGILSYRNCSLFSNSGASTTASTNSEGTVNVNHCTFACSFSTSSVGIFNNIYSQINNSANNATALTTAGTGVSGSVHGYYASGSASAVSVGAGTTFNSLSDFFNSSNTNAVTGAGTIFYNHPSFLSTSSLINTTTQTGGTIYGRADGTNPNAGIIGEQLTATATSVAITSTTSKTIASVSLTPGVWDVSAIIGSTATGGTGILSSFQMGINTTTDSLVGTTIGVDRFSNAVAATSLASGVVPQLRVTLAATTVYYAVVNVTYSSTTCPTSGRISATRVG